MGRGLGLSRFVCDLLWLWFGFMLDIVYISLVYVGCVEWWLVVLIG